MSQIEEILNILYPALKDMEQTGWDYTSISLTKRQVEILVDMVETDGDAYE